MSFEPSQQAAGIVANSTAEGSSSERLIAPVQVDQSEGSSASSADRGATRCSKLNSPQQVHQSNSLPDDTRAAGGVPGRERCRSSKAEDTKHKFTEEHECDSSTMHPKDSTRDEHDDATAGGRIGEGTQALASLQALLKRVQALTEEHDRGTDQSSPEFLALVPEALRCLKDAVSILNGTQARAHADQVSSLFEQCEKALLMAADDCPDDEACQRTLDSARELAHDVLGNDRYKQVCTKSYQQRLRRYLRGFDDILRGFGHAVPQPDTPLPVQRGASCSTGVLLESNDWPEQEHQAMQIFCDELYRTLLPRVSDIERVETVRQHVEWALRSRFEEARVAVFGSSAGQLAIPDSDIDLTVCLPTRARLMQELRDTQLAAQETIAAVEKQHPTIVKLLEERVKRDKKLKSHAAALKGQRQALVAMNRARKIQQEHLRGLQAERRARNECKAEGGGEHMPGMPHGHGKETEVSNASKTDPQKSQTPQDSSGVGVAAQSKAIHERGKEAVKATDKAKNELDIEEALAKLEDSAAIDRAKASVQQAEARLEREKKVHQEWMSKHFDACLSEQAAAVKALSDARATLDATSSKLKATGKIVFEIKRIIERKGFAQGQAVARSRVPVVKMKAPAYLSGPNEEALGVDICINNLVAIHNTRLVSTYTSLDPRCRQLLYLVKAWAKARGVNDSTRGTLSSYAHCVAALHYLIRAGVVPSLLEEHPSLRSAESSRSPMLVEGIDVYFKGIPQSRTPPTHPESAPHDRAVRQRMSQAFDAGADRAENPVSAGVESATGQERATHADSAEICDLLAGYFRYFTETFRHSTEVMTLRPKSILVKRKSWNRPKLWRISIEDPFETFDSVKPHDLGCVLTRTGQAVLREEWLRGHDLLRRGGVASLEELFTPCDTPNQSKPRRNPRQGGHGGRGAHAPQSRQGNGATTPPGSRRATSQPHPQPGRLWNPGPSKGRGPRPRTATLQPHPVHPIPYSSTGSHSGVAHGHGHVVNADQHRNQGPPNNTPAAYASPGQPSGRSPAPAMPQQYHPSHGLLLASGARAGFALPPGQMLTVSQIESALPSSRTGRNEGNRDTSTVANGAGGRDRGGRGRTGWRGSGSRGRRQGRRGGRGRS